MRLYTPLLLATTATALSGGFGGAGFSAISFRKELTRSSGSCGGGASENFDLFGGGASAIFCLCGASCSSLSVMLSVA